MNLKAHAIKCVGVEVVDNGIATASVKNDLIFSLFTCPGQQPMKYSYCAHTSIEAQYMYFLVQTPDETQQMQSAHLVKWVTKST